MIPSKFVIAAIVAASIFAAGAATGHRLTANYYRAVIAAEKAAQDEAIIKAQQEALAEVERQKQIARGVNNDYQKRISDLRARYLAELDGLRKRTEDGGDLETGAAGARDCSGTAPGNRLPRETQENLIRLVQIADEQAQRLLACQAWIQKQ